MSAEWIATYRLQLHAGFPLPAAREILPYLAGLGITHVYLSPCLQAVPGSQHGYDVTDPAKISDDIGGEAAWTAFVQAARAQGLRVLLDIVPNHMSASHHNPWWDDVLRHGPFSQFAGFFDFRNSGLQPFRVHVCSLAKPYGAALAAGEITIALRQRRPRIEHYDNSWPVSPVSWSRLVPGNEAGFERLRHLLDIERPNHAQRSEYARLIAHAEQLLDEAHDSGALEAAVARVGSNPEQLDALLQEQFYVLHGWKLAGELTNYRRFFDVGALVGLRMELPAVMAAAHQRIQSMIRDGEIDGVRVDHPDGLRAPREYFRRLRRMLPAGRIYVEKILENDEKLAEDWPIDGTVGYEFLAKVNRLWMDDQRTDVLTAAYADFTAHSVNIGKLVREKKRAIIESTFSSEQAQLAAALLRIARTRVATRDLSPRQLNEALARLIVALPVYRTYRTADGAHAEDKRIFAEAIQSARMSASDIDPAAFDFLSELLAKPGLNAAESDFVAKWQQLTPAVMAKGVEDTTFYCFDRLLSCNEVGSQASLVGISADRFHEFCHYLSERHPRNMLATSTHDNKRSEDVRTRISILSEIPERWSEVLNQWSSLTTAAWRNRTPDRHAEYLLYQTLIGAWPISPERCWQYMQKACREAKIKTSWHEPNLGYEENIRGFVQGVFQVPEFIEALEKFVEPLILPGRINSLAQTLIKMVAPGLPDFYQGTELWDLSLVDPDNRRPVDFALRTQLLERARGMQAAAVLQEWDSGLPKLWMITRILALRRAHSELFAPACRYQPLVAQGSHLAKLLAFRRGDNLITVVPRLTMTLGAEWDDTRLPLPGGQWRNCFTDEVVQREILPASLFAGFPVALLIKVGA
jgi:(1->4)-alpha-D-glucan 1-alpha-D-glucosylmutase